jgi:hypothetical protein
VQAGGIGDGDVESCGVGDNSHCGRSAVVMVVMMVMFMRGWRGGGYSIFLLTLPLELDLTV